jgi:hypothetical protein
VPQVEELERRCPNLFGTRCRLGRPDACVGFRRRDRPALGYGDRRAPANAREAWRLGQRSGVLHERSIAASRDGQTSAPCNFGLCLTILVSTQVSIGMPAVLTALEPVSPTARNSQKSCLSGDASSLSDASPSKSLSARCNSTAWRICSTTCSARAPENSAGRVLRGRSLAELGHELARGGSTGHPG